MKKKLKILIPLFLVFAMTAVIVRADETSSAEEKDNSLLLDNGLAVYVQKRDHIPLANIVFAVNVGSKDEDDRTSGLVHILEHLIFLGETEFHTADEINREMRGHGALINAHTSHDQMTIELSVPAQSWKFGLQLIKEKVFHLKFSQERLDKEKKVIFEEIAQHQDNPTSLGTSLTLQYLFKGHPYERPISGNREVIEKATVEDIQVFYRHYFVASNCALAVVGDVNLQDICASAREIFGKLPKNNEPIKHNFKMVPGLKKNVNVKRHLDIAQAHLFVAFYAPPMDHDHQLDFYFLDYILGEGVNPVLRTALYKRGRPLTYGVSTRYIALKYGGAFLIHLTLDPKNLKQAQWELLKFLNNAWSFKYSVEDYPWDERIDVMDYLETAKSNIKFTYQQFQELGLNAAVNYARFVLFHKNVQAEETREPYMTRVEKIKSSHIRDAASRYFSGKKYVTISILPEKKK
jgi:zinc protease